MVPLTLEDSSLLTYLVLRGQRDLRWDGAFLCSCLALLEESVLLLLLALTSTMDL